MAAFHFAAKIHSRARGSSAVRAAAYRAGERLVDERTGRTEDYTRKADVIETAILAPAGSPDWVQGRAQLWNRAESRERRKDSQVAQELEINLPRELSDAENWRLVTDFCRDHLVSHGRICDIAFHKGRAGDGGEHPHAHILMPVREIGPEGFGEKHSDCSWKTFLRRRDRLEELREVWCDFARQRAVELGYDLGPDWDHRSFADRGVDLEGSPKLGATAQRLEAEKNAADRAAEIEKVRRENGDRLLARPAIVLEALTNRQSTFTDADLARWIHRHSADDQFSPILEQARACAIRVGKDDHGRERYSTAEMIALEQRMVDDAASLAARTGHPPLATERVEQSGLSDEQKDAARHLLASGDLACLVGYAGAGKSTLLAEVRAELQRSGYNVRGATLSGIAADGLTRGSGIEARTVASLLMAWENDRDLLAANDVLVIDEAGMVGSRDLARLVTAAREAKAKLILVGDPEQLQAINAGAAFRAIAERTGATELTEVRRQQVEWQRQATREFATARTADALTRYRDAGCLHGAANNAEAKAHLVAAWRAAQSEAPAKSRIMLTHTRADVRQLNDEARAVLMKEGTLGDSLPYETSHGKREFAPGDRLIFLRNERQLGVRNGTLGTISQLGDGQIRVCTDDGRTVSLDPDAYRDFDHGYAMTVHKAQGITVDESFVLATRGFDRHLAYVACSRHRERLHLVHSQEAFAGDRDLALALSRERAKDTTLDYRESADPAPREQKEAAPSQKAPPRTPDDLLAHARARARQRPPRQRDRELEP